MGAICSKSSDHSGVHTIPDRGGRVLGSAPQSYAAGTPVKPGHPPPRSSLPPQRQTPHPPAHKQGSAVTQHTSPARTQSVRTPQTTVTTQHTTPGRTQSVRTPQTEVATQQTAPARTQSARVPQAPKAPQETHHARTQSVRAPKPNQPDPQRTAPVRKQTVQVSQQSKPAVQQTSLGRKLSTAIPEQGDPRKAAVEAAEARAKANESRGVQSSNPKGGQLSAKLAAQNRAKPIPSPKKDSEPLVWD